MSAVSTVDKLTEIIEKQAAIIRKQYSAIEQLNATTSFDDEVILLTAETQEILNQLGACNCHD